MRILIVEDERALCDTLAKSLRQKGYEVDACYDGDSALDWLLAEKDMAGLSFFLKRTEPDRDTLAAACQQAREAGAAEAVALLLEEQHRRFPAGMDKSFDL